MKYEKIKLLISLLKEALKSKDPEIVNTIIESVIESLEEEY